MPSIENVIVRYKVPRGTRVTGVRLFVPADYSQRVEQDVLHVTLPKVDKYQGVIIEME